VRNGAGNGDCQSCRGHGGRKPEASHSISPLGQIPDGGAILRPRRPNCNPYT
jgi:hypothetical protein